MQLAVLGSGVVGLTTSYLLAKGGHEVTCYASRSTPKTTSDAACALWYPLWAGPTDNVLYTNKLDHWCKRSWQQFGTLLSEGAGISTIQNTEFFRSIDDAKKLTENLARLEVISQPTAYPAAPANFTCAINFSSYLIETPIYMPFLKNLCSENGVTFKEAIFENIGEVMLLPESMIFNCLGIGAAKLFNDNNLVGVGGHLLLLPPVSLPGAIGAEDFCIIPRKDALIVGSVYDIDATEGLNVDRNRDWLLEQAEQWQGIRNTLWGSSNPAIGREHIVSEITGLRPVRKTGVRLQSEVFEKKVIIHNYGHGGSGITLSWGTALEAIALLEEYR